MQLLVMTREKLKSVRTYSFDRPTYNVLTVIIIRFLQAVLAVGVVAQLFRTIFYLFGNDFGRDILMGQFGLYYAY